MLDDVADVQSEYVRHTAIRSTVLTDRSGGAVRVTDFAPRFRQFKRVFRLPQLLRVIKPLATLPRITMRVKPTHYYGQLFPYHSVVSNRIRCLNEGSLTTDGPLLLIERESPFVLARPLHYLIGCPCSKTHAVWESVCR